MLVRERLIFAAQLSWPHLKYLSNRLSFIANPEKCVCNGFVIKLEYVENSSLLNCQAGSQFQYTLSLTSWLLLVMWDLKISLNVFSEGSSLWGMRIQGVNQTSGGQFLTLVVYTVGFNSDFYPRGEFKEKSHIISEYVGLKSKNSR